MTEQYDPEEASRPENDVEKLAQRRGLPRRTILTGAAWAVPTIVLVTATPAAAVSVTPTLTFTNGPYEVDGCGVITAMLQATTDGTTPAVGELVMVTPPDGFTWSDGSTATRTFTTDGSGQVTLDDLIPENANGTYTLTATSTATASTTVTVTLAGTSTIQQFLNNSVTQSWTVPAGSLVFGAGYALAPNGDLYYGATIIGTGYTDASATWDADGNYAVAIKSDGTVHQFFNNTLAQTWTVPAGSDVFGAGYALAPNGNLYYGATIIGSGYTAVSADRSASGNIALAVKSDGTVNQFLNSTLLQTYALPAGSQPYGAGYALAPNGDLYYGATIIGTGYTDASSTWDGSANYALAVRPDGTVNQFLNNTLAQTWTVPAGSDVFGA